MASIDFEVQGPVAIIRLNRPELRNAVDTEMTGLMRAALTRLDADDSLRVAILTGAGKVFCAGMDLGAFAKGERPGLTDPDHFAGFVSARRRKPIIAAVNGAAIAGGFEIMLSCDMVIAEQGAIFALPEVKRGILAAGGAAFRLPHRLPVAIAHEMLLTGDPLSTDRALALGLVNAVVAAEDVMPKALALAQRIAENAPLAVALTLELTRQSIARGETEAWAASDAAWARVDGSADALEGATAFKEKRLPVWTGR